LRASTVRAYESHVRLYLQPHLGGVPLAELSAADVAGMFASIARRPVLPGRALSPGRVTRLRATLRTVLSAAARAGLVERNAARDVELPAGRRPHPLVWTDSRVRAWRVDHLRPPVAVWTPAQTAAFLVAVEDDAMGLLFRLVALRGLRRGEVCGL
jgi:integrase